MELLERWQKVNAILQGLDFDRLFPGFRPYPFALYTRQSICLNGRVKPYDECFRGNTSLWYQHEWIAIWNLDMDFVEDTQELAYHLVHEMMHCHQNKTGETAFPSDFVLMNAPDEIEYYKQKFTENQYLVNAWEHSDFTAFGCFAALRQKRMNLHPAYVQEEEKAEKIEGFAEYIGLKALQMLNTSKFEARLKNVLRLLRSESPALFDSRRIAYDTGTLYFFCLEKLGHPLPSKIPPLISCPKLSDAYADMLQTRQERINAHVSRTAYTPCNAIICGYDPMNMFRYFQHVYCSHFVYLQAGQKMFVINGCSVLVLKDGSGNEVMGYYGNQKKEEL